MRAYAADRRADQHGNRYARADGYTDSNADWPNAHAHAGLFQPNLFRFYNRATCRVLE
jgi:hypothetical protein